MTADTVGGVWTYAAGLAAALDKYAVEVVLATMGAPLTAAQRAEVQAISNITVFESRFRLEWMDDPWRDVEAAGEWLLQLADQTRPDAVHLNGYAHGALPWRAPVLIVAHSCVASWWMAVKGVAAPTPAWDRYRLEVTRGLQAADLVVAPTRAMLLAVEEHYGPVAFGRVVPNGRDAACFPIGLKEDFVITAGRVWDEAKNVQALNQIAPDLPWPIYVAGEGKHPANTSDKGTAQQLGNLHPLGQCGAGALAAWLGRASIYALPARYEPFGLSALEAALAGCALVLGDVPSLREVWGEEAAVFVRPDDTRALRETLAELIADASRRTRLAACARTQALEFTTGRMAASYWAIYCDLLL